MQSDDPATCWEANAETWAKQARAGFDVYRDAVNTPAFLALLPPVTGLTGLDVGCGEGGNTRKLAALGARMTGLDIAPTFIRYAKEAEAEKPQGIQYMLGNALELPFADASFDFATACMSVMDMGDPGKGIAEMARCVKPGGFVQFSILHPCFAPPHRKVLRGEDGVPYAVELAEYFKTGPHVEEWYFGKTTEEERKHTPPFRVPYVHLTLPGWLDCITAAGMQLAKLGEPTAPESVAEQVPDVLDTRIVPLFLHFLCKKPLG